MLVGKVVLEVYLQLVGAGSGSRLSYLLRWDILSELIGSTLSNLPLLLWSGWPGYGASPSRRSTTPGVAGR